jgi:hypothetical protein
MSRKIYLERNSVKEIEIDYYYFLALQQLGLIKEDETEDDVNIKIIQDDCDDYTVSIDLIIDKLQQLKEAGANSTELISTDEGILIIAGYDVKEASQEKIQIIENRNESSRLHVLKVERERMIRRLQEINEELMNL